MKKIKPQLLIVLFISTFLNACSDVIDVDVPNGGNRLVIEASINWEKGTAGNNQMIRLSRSTEYFVKPEERMSPVTGAIVRVIRDRDEMPFTFIDQNDGTYVTNQFGPELDQSYTLEISHNGQVYRGNEKFTSVIDVKAVNQTTEGGFSSDDIEVNLIFDDPRGQKNYYLGESRSIHRAFPFFQTLNDHLSDGGENFFVFEEEDYNPGDTVELILHGISERYHNYMEIIVLQSETTPGGLFQTTPVQVKGNCSNIMDSEEEVLGYFQLSEVVTSQYVIQ